MLGDVVRILRCRTFACYIPDGTRRRMRLSRRRLATAAARSGGSCNEQWALVEPRDDRFSRRDVKPSALYHENIWADACGGVGAWEVGRACSREGDMTFLGSPALPLRVPTRSQRKEANNITLRQKKQRKKKKAPAAHHFASIRSSGRADNLALGGGRQRPCHSAVQQQLHSSCANGRQTLLAGGQRQGQRRRRRTRARCDARWRHWCRHLQSSAPTHLRCGKRFLCRFKTPSAAAAIP